MLIAQEIQRYQQLGGHLRALHMVAGYFLSATYLLIVCTGWLLQKGGENLPVLQ